MKRSFLFVICSVLFTSFAARAQDYYLQPDNFMLQKSALMKVRVMMATAFDHPEERPYQGDKTDRMALYNGTQEINLVPFVQEDGLLMCNYPVNTPGLALMEMQRNYVRVSKTRDAFLKYITDEGLTTIVNMVNKSAKTAFVEKYTRYMKTLVRVEDPKNSTLYSKELGHNLEITLKTNPYLAAKGGPETALIKFMGKPLPNAQVQVVTRDLDGKVSMQTLTTNKAGEAKFILTVNGTYLIRLIHMIPARDVNFEGFWATYTFGL